jgi:hypothetical protein
MKQSLKFIILMILNTFISCREKDACDKGEPYTNNIREKTRNNVPYKDFAELTFIDSASQDTHVFIGTGWKTKYWYYNDYSNECQNGSNNEKYYQNFLSSTYPNLISFSIEYPHPCCEYIIVSTGKSIFYLAAGNLSYPYSHDSLIIRNYLYYNVDYFKNQYQPQWDTKYGCYFNKTHGVLKIELPDGPLELYKFKNP